MRPLRYIVAKILGNINPTNPPTNPPSHRLSQQDKPAMDFKFQFQHDIADGTNGGENQKEAEANELIVRLRQEDEVIFKQQSLLPGGHFLHIRDILDDTSLFHVARMIPKGAHLHLHFNSALLPGVLLGYAKDMANMYVWGDRQLRTEDDFRKCKLEFSLRNLELVRKEMRAKAAESEEMRKAIENADNLLSEDAKIRAYDKLGPNMFSADYQHGRKDKNQHVEEMRYQYFRECWDEKRWGSCDDWLISKLTFNREEVDSFFKEAEEADLAAELDTEAMSFRENPTRSTPVQPAPGEPTTLGFNERNWRIETTEKILDSDSKRIRNSAHRAWGEFNGRTKMMKGLFNYETAFRRYTRQCLEDFVKDNVQYAEIRPNFMQTNQILNDTAEFKIDNFGTMRVIIDEYEKFMKHNGDMGDDGEIVDNAEHRPTLSGMKVIYCTPRSFKREAVMEALNECIEMKKKWPQYIAGFDLVGEEAFPKPYPLRYFEAEFRKFRMRCNEENLDIPFLFHCGETPDDLEGNLETALELDSRRIGHGYALPVKTGVLAEMKSKNVCVETCPISNMILGLAERMDQHSVYRLLEEKMHCTVSSDNGTLFNSTLSHDFYEVMAGNEKINLYGWKQLARWSIEHACLSPDELRRTLVEWEKRWEEFIDAITELSSAGSRPPGPPQLEVVRRKLEAARISKL
ncbi:hypothetical protein F4861DRAFT_539158 [Xylaria intraflava]|nr:hypothetical protein F4861DRAFT_539158 [Xylaria intraflava]